MGGLSDFICKKKPICGSIEVEVKDLKISNTSYHGDLWCHLIPDSLVASGAKSKVEKDIAPLRKKWECDTGCACTQVKIAEFEVKHNQHIHRRKVYSTGELRRLTLGTVNIPHGNCRVTFDLEFKLEFRVYLGICHDPDFSKVADALTELTELLEKLKKLGDKIKGLTDPDEIWKKIGGVSPKALRESPGVEKPRRIRRRKPKKDTGKQPQIPPGTSSGSATIPQKYIGLRGGNFWQVYEVLTDDGFGVNLDYVRTTDNALFGKVLNISVSEDPSQVNIMLAVAQPEVINIEDIGEGFSERLSEHQIANLYQLSTVSPEAIKITGVSANRLVQWRDMAKWLIEIPFIDGNAAELLVRGIGLSSPQDAAAWIRGKDDAALKHEILEASTSIKLPENYAESHLSVLKIALRLAAEQCGDAS